MRNLIRWATKLYPPAWRDRYGVEFDALLNEVGPSWRDLFNVLGGALSVRARSLIEGHVPVSGHVYSVGSPYHFRPAVLITLIGQAIIFS